MFDWADQTLTTWVGIFVGVLTLGMAYLALPRRKLDILFAHSRLVNEPVRAIDISVTTHDGKIIEQPVYLVHIQIRCSGNRDVAMAPEGEFIEIEAEDGLELVGSYFNPPGKTRFEVIENTTKSTKFKFDLLKQSDTLALNLYLTSRRDITRLRLLKLFRTTVHVRDVKPILLAKNRMESMGLILMGIGFLGFVGLFQAFSLYAPVDQSKLLEDENQRRVAVLLSDEPGKLRVCETVQTVWEKSICREQPISEVGTFQPATKSDSALFVNVAAFWSRLQITLLYACFMAMFFWGNRITDYLVRILSNITKK